MVLLAAVVYVIVTTTWDGTERAQKADVMHVLSSPQCRGSLGQTL
jgi:hypothetical protein